MMPSNGGLSQGPRSTQETPSSPVSPVTSVRECRSDGTMRGTRGTFFAAQSTRGNSLRQGSGRAGQEIQTPHGGSRGGAGGAVAAAQATRGNSLRQGSCRSGQEIQTLQGGSRGGCLDRRGRLRRCTTCVQGDSPTLCREKHYAPADPDTAAVPERRDVSSLVRAVRLQRAARGLASPREVRHGDSGTSDPGSHGRAGLR